MVITDTRKLTRAEIAAEALSIMEQGWLRYAEDSILLTRDTALRMLELLQEIERRETLKLIRPEDVCAK